MSDDSTSAENGPSSFSQMSEQHKRLASVLYVRDFALTGALVNVLCAHNVRLSEELVEALFDETEAFRRSEAGLNYLREVTEQCPGNARQPVVE